VLSRVTPRVIGAVAALFGAASVPASSTPVQDPVGQAAPLRLPTPLGLDAYTPTPDDNPLTRAAVELGRRLFFDPALSRDRTVSCATCHRPDRMFADGVRRSSGVLGRPASRHTPTLVNRAYGRRFFWDGRTSTLEETVLQPIQNPREMDLALDELLARLRAVADYGPLFDRAFDGGVTADNVARALASYVRTLRSGDAPFDRFLAGDEAALTADAVVGFRLFVGRAHCSACHSGPTLTDDDLHNTGISWGAGDLGRYAVTREDGDRGRFKTPTLRNASLTAPYMHDGSLATLEEVVEFYDRGGNPNPNLDPEIRPLRLTEHEKRQLLGFLRALTGSDPPAGDPPPRAAVPLVPPIARRGSWTPRRRSSRRRSRVRPTVPRGAPSR